MKLSVAMCTFNGARFLQAQLDSIAAQSHLPDELVICDDASTDNTSSLIAAFAAEAPFRVTQVRNKSTLGVVRNFEQAIALCHGELIALADQDDFWNTNKLETMISHFAAHPDTGMLFTDAEVIDEQGNSLGYRLWEGKSIEFAAREKELFKSNRSFEVLLTRNPVTGATIAFRSKFKPMVLPIPLHPRFLHDGWIAILISAVSRVDFIEQPLMKYRRHSGQQIGVGKELPLTASQSERKSAPAQLRALGASSFAPELIYLRLIIDRITSSGERVIYPDFDKVLDKLQHFEARSALPASRLGRVAPVAREALSGRYWRYSRGLRSAAKDIIFQDKNDACQKSRS